MSLRLRQLDENVALRRALMKRLREIPCRGLVLIFVESGPRALPERQAAGGIAGALRTWLSARGNKRRNLQKQYKQEMLHGSFCRRDASSRRTLGITVPYCAGEALLRKASKHDRARARSPAIS